MGMHCIYVKKIRESVDLMSSELYNASLYTIIQTLWVICSAQNRAFKRNSTNELKNFHRKKTSIGSSMEWLLVAGTGGQVSWHARCWCDPHGWTRAAVPGPAPHASWQFHSMVFSAHCLSETLWHLPRTQSKGKPLFPVLLLSQQAMKHAADFIEVLQQQPWKMCVCFNLHREVSQSSRNILINYSLP